MPDPNPATNPPYPPHREYPGAIGKDGSPRLPVNDVDAKAAGYDKVVKISDSSVSYRYSADRKEMVLSGAYTWTPWP